DAFHEFWLAMVSIDRKKLVTNAIDTVYDAKRKTRFNRRFPILIKNKITKRIENRHAVVDGNILNNMRMASYDCINAGIDECVSELFLSSIVHELIFITPM